MNDRQRKFCEQYAANPNATEAAKAAGYSPHTAYSIGQRLLKNVEIKKYIDETKTAARTEKIASMTETLEYLTAVMRNSDELTRERIKAARLLTELLSEETGDEAQQVHVIVERRLVDLRRDDE